MTSRGFIDRPMRRRAGFSTQIWVINRDDTDYLPYVVSPSKMGSGHSAHQRPQIHWPIHHYTKDSIILTNHYDIYNRYRYPTIYHSFNIIYSIFDIIM